MVFFFFKQKTAYEMRISDWSSDVCSSDLFLDSPRIVASTSASDFTFAGLKEGVSTVFLCLPPDRLDAYSRWLRLLVAQALTDMARSVAKPARPVLFLLDEFAALGRLETVERSEEHTSELQSLMRISYAVFCL